MLPAPGRAFGSTPCPTTWWKVRRAVVPISSFSSSAEPMPGTWIRIRSAPWRWMVGSRVPTSSTRRRTISSDCWMVRSSVAARSASDRPTIRFAPLAVMSRSLDPAPDSEATGVASERAISTARAICAGSPISMVRRSSGPGTRRTAPITSRSFASASRSSGHSAFIRDL